MWKCIRGTHTWIGFLVPSQKGRLLCMLYPLILFTPFSTDSEYFVLVSLSAYIATIHHLCCTKCSLPSTFCEQFAFSISVSSSIFWYCSAMIYVIGNLKNFIFFSLVTMLSHIMNSPAWAWNEDSSTIVKKYYFYYLFQERSYLSQSPAQVKNNVPCRTQMQIGLDTWIDRSLLVTQMISIYISYELIHACLHPPRTPIPHAGLLSFLKIASVQFCTEGMNL